VDDLARFLGPLPGQVYVYALLDDASRASAATMVVTGVSRAGPSELVVREEHSMAWKPAPDGVVSTAVENRLTVDERGLVQRSRLAEMVLIGAPLKVGTEWTRPVSGYSPDKGEWRGDMTCRIAMFETLPLFGETRVSVRVVGKAQFGADDLMLVEQYASGIGLVLRRQYYGRLAPSETVLEEVRVAPLPA
jgi:hypothetical protein